MHGKSVNWEEARRIMLARTRGLKLGVHQVCSVWSLKLRLSDRHVDHCVMAAA
jgi:hypothetical protein